MAKQPLPALCSACGRSDGLHASWGLRGDVIDEVRCNGVFDGKHCPNTAPIGSGGFCGPCRWSKEKRTTITEAEMAMETLSEHPPKVIND